WILEKPPRSCYAAVCDIVNEGHSRDIPESRAEIGDAHTDGLGHLCQRKRFGMMGSDEFPGARDGGRLISLSLKQERLAARPKFHRKNLQQFQQCLVLSWSQNWRLEIRLFH